MNLWHRQRCFMPIIAPGTRHDPDKPLTDVRFGTAAGVFAIGNPIMSSRPDFIPALRVPQLTRYYDAALATVFQERRFRLPLVQALAVQPGERVLDVGCGTATLSLLIAAHTPAGLVAGIDIDPVMLTAAQRKVAAADAAISLALGSAAELPYAAGSFDCVASSVMLHHLPTAQKHAMLAEVLRLLAPRGRTCVLDFGPFGRGAPASALSRLLGSFEEVGDNLAGRIPTFMREAGFADVAVRDAAFGGVLKLYTGRKP
jgi:SAM-dependent methyltransferase